MAMTEPHLDRLLFPAADRDLGDLEADIWRRLALRRTEARRLGAVVSCQAAVLVAALAAAAVWGGAAAARSQGQDAGLGAFSPRMAMAPSTRLAGPAL